MLMEIEKKKTDENSDEENSFLLKFTKPYLFEGETYEEIDLSALENLNAADMIEIQKTMTKQKAFEAVPEISLQYACIAASRMTGKPIEYFTMLPAKYAMKLKNIVSNFIVGED